LEITSDLTRVLPYRSTTDYIEGVVITFVDITAKANAELAVRQSEERFRALVDASAQMVWTANAVGSMTEDSPSWRAFTGQSFEQLKGDGWLNAIHPDDRERAEEAWRRAIESKVTYTEEFRVHHAAGTYRWTSVRAVPLKDAQNAVRGWIGMNSDITDRKTGEETLREADRRKTEFLAVLAHELRNPLAPIRSGLEILKFSPVEPELLNEVCSMIERQTLQLVTLVDDLLDISRITRGTLHLRKQPGRFQDIVRSAVEEAKPLIETRR